MNKTKNVACCECHSEIDRTKNYYLYFEDYYCENCVNESANKEA